MKRRMNDAMLHKKTTEPYKNIPKFGKHTDPDKTKTINPGPAEPGYALPL